MTTTRSQPRPFLCLREATFRLGDRLIFPHSSWRFGRAEHWAVMGVNGSGKSLFGEALRGHLPLVRGDLTWHFRPPDGLAPQEAIGHVAFEDRKAEVHGEVLQSRWNSIEEEASLRVSEFLSYERVMEVNPFEVTDRHRRARPGFERRRRRAVNLLGITPLLEQSLISLSNGERQRVQWARALCHPLRLLILDDPFAGLDAAARQSFHRVLERLMSTTLRVLLLTSRSEDLPRRLTHVLWVDRCRLVAAGTRAEILRRPDLQLLCSSRRLPRHRKSAPAPAALKRAALKRQRELVRLRDVTVRYGSRLILDQVNWTVRAGESWALVGPNGSGKTTLLSLILGDHPQVYSNDVTVFGKNRGHGESVWDVRRQIGFVSPELHLYFEDSATCLEVIASGLEDTIGLYHPPTPTQRVAARLWLRRFGLLQFEQTPLYGLSLGCQRMVLLARALAKRPRLLILDEPCQGLDAAHRNAFNALVERSVRSRALTAIYVTHRSEEIPPSIRRVFRLP